VKGYKVHVAVAFAESKNGSNHAVPFGAGPFVMAGEPIET